jgi:hypothetical protein
MLGFASGGRPFVLVRINLDLTKKNNFFFFISLFLINTSLVRRTNNMDARIILPFDCDNLEDASPRFAEWSANLRRLLNIRNVVDDARRLDHLFLYGGQSITRIYQPMTDPNDDFDAVIEKLRLHFNPVANVPLNIFKFRNLDQREGEPFDDFVARLREKATTYNFDADMEHQLGFQVMAGCSDQRLREDLLARPGITLNKLIQLGRTRQTVANQLAEIAGAHARTVNRVEAPKRPQDQPGRLTPHEHKHPREPTKSF